MPAPTITTLPTAPQRSQPATFSSRADALLAALAGFVSEANALGAYMHDAVALAVYAESTTSISIATGSKTLTVQTGKALVLGMSVKIASSASPTNWMHGDVTAYNAETGALTVAVGTTAGSGTYAAWQVSLSGPSAASGSLLRVTTFTSSGTWNKGTGTGYVLVKVLGGGGGGGGGTYGSTGGSSGGYSEKFINVAAITSETVTVGTGGAAGSGGNDGSAGNTSSFGAHCSATGGGRGRSNSNGQAIAPGVGSGGDINLYGGLGHTTSASAVGGHGGASYFGGGGHGKTNSYSALETFAAGAGGGGGSDSNSTGTAGGGGIVIVYEYA